MCRIEIVRRQRIENTEIDRIAKTMATVDESL